MKMWKKGKSTRWKIVDSLFFSLFITSIIIEFSDIGAGFIDGLIISRFAGPEAMAAQGIAYPLFTITAVISGLVAVGMQVKCSQLVGRGKTKDISRFFSMAVYVGIAASLIFLAVILVFAGPVSLFLGAPEKGSVLQLLSADYLRGIGFGIPAFILTAIFGPALQMDSGRRIIQTGAVIQAAADVVLDLLVVRAGSSVFLIGLASSVASYLNLAWMCTHFLKKDRMLHFVRPGISVKEYLLTLTYGTEKAVKKLAGVVRPIILNKLIIFYGGTMAMSAMSIRNNFSNFTGIVAMALSSVVSLLAGLYYGEANEEAIKEVKHCEWRYILILMSIMSALILLLARPIASLYVTQEGPLMEIVVFSIRMLALQNPLQALVDGRIPYLQAICRRVNMNLLIAASKLVFVIAGALIFGKFFGIYGVLCCYSAGYVLSLLAILIFYQVKTRKFVPSEDDILNLPAEFHLHPGDVISLDIRNLEDAVNASEQLLLFCKGHRYDEKTSFYALLSLEELAVNIVTHGFPQNKRKNPIAELRVVAKGDELIIRLRDDCPLFDVTKLMEKAAGKGADLSENIGVRIMTETAANIEYTRAFETNNLLIRYENCRAR